jgi:hypothetical protein
LRVERLCPRAKGGRRETQGDYRGTTGGLRGPSRQGVRRLLEAGRLVGRHEEERDDHTRCRHADGIWTSLTNNDCIDDLTPPLMWLAPGPSSRHPEDQHGNAHLSDSGASFSNTAVSIPVYVLYGHSVPSRKPSAHTTYNPSFRRPG